MLWLNPAAWIALVAVAAPILIHIFVQRRARPVPFPTLRFLQPTRLAAIRRHVLEDWPLLAVRAAILAAAVTAFASPVFLRRQTWNARVTRAVVADESLVRAGAASAALKGCTTDCRVFEARSLPEGIRRARVWLESAPPSRREIAIASPFAIGSISAATVASIPVDIGLRFERVGELPKQRTVDGGAVLGLDDESRVPNTESRLYRREVTLAGPETKLHEEPAGLRPFPIDVIAAPSARAAIDRAIAAVLSRHIWAPPSDRHAVLVVSVASVRSNEAGPEAEPVKEPWIADAIARISADRDLVALARARTGSLDPARFDAPPWIGLVRATNGSLLASAAASRGKLLLATSADASSFFTPVLLRAAVNAMAEPPDLRGAEVLPIADDQLRAWTRPPGPVTRVRTESVGGNDRRWLWVLVLLLTGVEYWMRRTPAASTAERRTPNESDEGTVRVA